MTKSTSDEAECRNFWDAASHLRSALRLSLEQAEINQYLEEIEAIAMHTEQPDLRSKCVALLADYGVQLSLVL